MKPQQLTVRVAAPPARVFEAFSDFRAAAGRVSGITKIEMLTDGPIRAGTRFRETRVMFGRECTETMEVSAWSPGRSYTLRCDSCGARVESTFDFAPASGGTDVTLRMEWRPLTFMARLMMPVMGLLMGGSLLKCVRQDLDDVRRFVENPPAAAPA